MTNYEKYKNKIDISFEENAHIAINKNTNEITYCSLQKCSDCLFSSQYNNNILCRITAMKWLVSEYIEPEIDWSKVPVNTPTLVSDDGKKWSRRHFSRVVNGIPYTWMYGNTSWTAHNNPNNEIAYRYIKLAEGRE